MNATASLITGGVLLFGVAGLANLYLPPPGMTAPHASVAAVTIPESPALAPPRAESPAEVRVAAVPSRAPDAAPASAPTVATTVAPAPVTDRPTVAATPKAAPPASGARSFFSSLFPKSPPAAPPSVMTPSMDTGPIVSTPGPARAAEPAPPGAGGDGETGFALSATSQDKAWIRIGDHRTVMAKAGDNVPGLGRIASIGTNLITLESGRVMRAAP